MSQIDWVPGLQADLISGRYATMLHEVAISCTCRGGDTFMSMVNDGTQSHQFPFCPRCKGTGWLYRSPSLIIGMATGIRQQRNILDAGIAQPGDMTYSPQVDGGGMPCHGNGGAAARIGAWDKLTATWEQPLDDGHVISRGAATAYGNQGLKTGLDESEDRLWYEPSSAIWCEDENGTTYSEGSDFVLGPGKVIKWVGNKPYLGQRYSLKYQAFFEWIVFQPPQERIDRDRNLGPVVFLRKRHVAFVNEPPVSTDDDRVTLKSKCAIA